MDRPIRNVDRPEIKTKEDAIVLWMKETQPPEYAKIVEGGYSDEDGYSTWWEPARYELHKIIDWLLSPVTKRRKKTMTDTKRMSKPMTENELRAEKKRLDEEEERRNAEMVAMAKASREKRIAEKEAKEKEKRHKKYLELKAEFEGKDGSEVTDKPKKKSVYACKYFKYEYDDLGKYPLCDNRNSKLQLCDCKRIYAQQVCPFYEKGELRGRWVISDEDKEAAEKFKQEFEGKVEK